MRTKVLVISHNSFSTFQSMGKALTGLFGAFDKEDLCQLYLYPSYPNIDVCNSYFRITDLEVLKSLFNSRKCGKIIEKKVIKENNLLFDDKIQKSTYKIGRKKKPYMMIARDLIWKFGKWNTDELLSWIKNENPDVVFYASGDSCFSYDVALNISKVLNIPLITYVCDDYYILKKETISPLYWIQRSLLRHKMRKVFNSSEFLVTICDKLSDEYQKLFNKKIVTFMTSSSFETVKENVKEECYGICYLGNVSLNRWESLVEIGQALQRISDKTGEAYYIDLYSMETDKDILKNFTMANGIYFHGGVSGSQVQEIMRKSKILIHTESMKQFYTDRVRYSVSTKIADSLASGTCIFAYGPEDVASIEYLAENKAACVVTRPEKLESALEELINNYDLQMSYVKNALVLASKRHNSGKDSRVLQKMIVELLNERIDTGESTTSELRL